MDNLEMFHLVSTKQEPECTFLVRRMMLRARDVSIGTCYPNAPSVTVADVRDALIECFPDVWRAWREWAGPGSDTVSFDSVEYFVPVRFAAHEAYEHLVMKGTLEHGFGWTIDELAARMKADHPKSYYQWLAEDENAVHHAVERLVRMDVLRFEGSRIVDGPAWTFDYLQAVSNAYRAEGQRLEIEAEAFGREMERLRASGCNTLAELEAQTKQ